MKVNCSHIIVIIQPTVWNRLSWALNSWGWQSESWLLSEEFQNCQIIKLEGERGTRKVRGTVVPAGAFCFCGLPFWKLCRFADRAQCRSNWTQGLLSLFLDLSASWLGWYFHVHLQAWNMWWIHASLKACATLTSSETICSFKDVQPEQNPNINS